MPSIADVVQALALDHFIEVRPVAATNESDGSESSAEKVADHDPYVSFLPCQRHPSVSLSFLHPHMQELIVGLAYFLCSVGTVYYYFWPKFFLLIQGFDLDKNFQLTNPKAPKDGGAPGALGEKSGDATMGTFDSKEEQVRKGRPLTRRNLPRPVPLLSLAHPCPPSSPSPYTADLVCRSSGDTSTRCPRPWRSARFSTACWPSRT